MAIPLDLVRLITDGVIESERLEYKKGWNPEKILHTICVFSNDYENVGGGYIIIGIEENDGMLIRDVAGVDSGQINLG